VFFAPALLHPDHHCFLVKTYRVNAPISGNAGKLSVMGKRCFVALLGVFLSIAPIRAEQLLTGVNLPNAARANAVDRAAVIQQVKSAGVRIVRFPVGKDISDTVEYAAQFYAQGIKINLIVDPQYPPNAPLRAPYPPDRRMYPSHALSDADPALSRTYFQALMTQMDARGVVLAGIELGNEINWSAFNGGFPLPGEGKILGSDDLEHDPEGQHIAKGFLQYLNILTVLKDVRDHSTLNRNTPILSAGLSPTGRARQTGQAEDGVAINATIQFLQAHGLDKLVDGYGLHFYPWGTLQQIDLNLQNNVVTECRPAGSAVGNPGWITEWGVSTPDMSPDDSSRMPEVQHLMNAFRTLAREGRLRTILYYSWNSSPGTKPDPITIYRDGHITRAGKIAITP
jgi:hypothetical protein